MTTQPPTKAPEVAQIPIPAAVIATSAQRPHGVVTVNCCDAWFTGISTCHCCSCHHTFSTPAGFDKHRTGSHAHDTRTCLDPAGMVFGVDHQRQGEPIFVDAGRSYPCWAFSGSDNRWIEASA